MRTLGFAVLLLLPGVAAQPLLVGVAPDLPGPGPADEGFAVGSSVGADLSGLRVTDGEGMWAFPPGTHLAAGQALWVVGDLSLWKRFNGPEPALELSSGTLAGDLALANGGDDVRLVDARGTTLDAFAWGDKAVVGMTGFVSYTSPGLLYLRDHTMDGTWVDTDDRSDWTTPRGHRIGESRLDAPTFHVEALTLYASPDSSFGVLTALVANARERLHLHVYELRSAALVDALVAARVAHPGLDLEVFVDDNPVGQTAPERHATADALRRIEAAGGNVTLGGAGRYDDFHLKVLVADQQVAVQSENWVESGVPQDPTSGNRGWGAVVPSAEMADWFARWMAADRASWDTKPFDIAVFDPHFSPPDRMAPNSGSYSPVVPAVTLAGDFEVTPWIAPDHTQDPRRDPIAHLVDSGRRRVDVEQLDLATSAANSLGWRSDDPLLSALNAAADRGVTVRVLAAAPFSQTDTGNAAALAALAKHGVLARELARPGIGTLHNKGLIVDDAVVLGSMNGNHHSRSANREVDLLLRGPGVADSFGQLFASDLEPPAPAADVGAIARDLHGLPPAPLPTLLVALLVVAVLRSRPWPSRPSPC
ncbi:MAG TPA: phospholipase D-like domain-containing protein [Candidatus Thermoplasmatota archaeon]|nr:phospholipase D-like domain-containing protein [Candidatus Thermoplasmatota archaeon]